MEYNMMQNFRDRDNENFCAAIMVAEADSLKEISEDFILPDYLPDVKRVVSTKAYPRLGNRFLGSGVLEYEGAVAYKVLYIAEDNRVRCAAFLSEFKNKILSEELGEDCVDVLRPMVTGVNCRMQNPRKLNIRCQAGVEGAVWKRSCFLPELYGARAGEEKNLETAQVQLDGISITNHRENGMVYTEDITLDASMPPVTEIICSSADLYVDECRVSGTELLLRGVCEFEAIYSVSTEDAEDYILLHRTLAYSQALDAPQIKEGSSVMASVLIEGVTVNVREDEFGKRRMIELDVNYGLDVEAIRAQTLYYCKDCYSTQRECQINSEKENIWQVSQAGRVSFSVNEAVLLKDLDHVSVREIKACMAQPMLTLAPTPSKKGYPVLEGKAKVDVLCKNEDGKYASVSLELPIRYEGDKALKTQDGRLLLDCRASGVRARTDHEKLYIDFEVMGNLLLLEKEQVNAIKVIRMTGQNIGEGDRSAVATLYFVQSGETLFDIAKRYKVARESLMERNALDGEHDLVGHPLLIPCKKS